MYDTDVCVNEEFEMMQRVIKCITDSYIMCLYKYGSIVHAS